MPYFVKSLGPVVLERGPYETEDEANRKRDELPMDALYAGQELYGPSPNRSEGLHLSLIGRNPAPAEEVDQGLAVEDAHPAAVIR